MKSFASIYVGALFALVFLTGCGQTPEEVSVRPVLYVPENAHAAVVLRPRRMLESDLMTKTGLAWVTSALPIGEWWQPREVEEVVAVFNFDDFDSPDFGVMVRTAKTIQRDKWILTEKDIEGIRWNLTETHGGMEMHRTGIGWQVKDLNWCAFPNDRVVVLSSDPDFIATMAKADGSGTLAQLMGGLTEDCDVAGAMTLESLREVIADEIEKRFMLPTLDPEREADPDAVANDEHRRNGFFRQRPEFDFLFDIPERLRDATFTLDLSGPQFAELQMRGYDKKSARSLRQMLAQGLTLSGAAWKMATGRFRGRGPREGMPGGMPHDHVIIDDGRVRKEPKSNNMMKNWLEMETGKAAADVVDELFGSTVVTQDGATVTARWKRPVSLETLIDDPGEMQKAE